MRIGFVCGSVDSKHVSSQLPFDGLEMFFPKPFRLVRVSLVLGGVVKARHQERAQCTEWFSPEKLSLTPYTIFTINVYL